MQFHHHGYVSGDPRLEDATGSGIDRPGSLPECVDVLIVGSGPAGMIAAAQLAKFPNITTRIVERRPGRLEIGQADGIQARSVETFQAFGFASRITDEAYRISEMAFWAPDPENPAQISRASVAPDDPGGAISEFPHLIVNQARVLDYFAEFARNAPARLEPDYGLEFLELQIHDGEEYPVSVLLQHVSGDRDGQECTVKAKYVVGCDGAHSRVREAIGRKHVGKRANHAWGVMDVLATTDFPDIRTKCAIQSSSGGSILLIPREGGHLFRMYVDLGEVAEDDHHQIRRTTLDTTIAKANQILHPYTLEVKNCAWYTVYEVGHRITDKFDDVPPEEVGNRMPRVFIAGDACHTHSAKAGQGMNVSMQDGWNIAWKLGHVLSGVAPESLLETYSSERHEVAQNLIDFDREWSSLMAKPAEEFEDPQELAEFYVKTAEFPAGFMTEYRESMITGNRDHQQLATGFPVGKRFKSAPVMRVCDGNPAHLGHHATADGRWRIYAFADSARPGEDSHLASWAEWMLSSPDSPVVKYTPKGSDLDSLFDVKVIFQQPHGDVEFGSTIPALFMPKVGPFQLTDYEKVYAIAPEADIFEARGIDRQGVVVVVRPDQYVSLVLPLNAFDELAAFFDGAMRIR
ncbi:3-hydroxybenzoate 4-monooxygenase [Marinobacter halodurans]|uniref:Alkyl hydroperoxide reductase subunit F n=1 Tax=Marinobacter halodurans TaxID=2528979 RepID=A0ABY1ZIU9_9GAMM|nr:FAD-binding monooxygenase [Marinobacter halodurans]TBW48745.1 3-hydroxybenzoate 4-monooxygenase [Marinobacter halodurans]